MRRPAGRERPEKILVAMHELSKGTTRPLKYEDIVVAAFQAFPDEFALRGYPQYPDSSDIHKPLYGVLKRQGLIRSANKTFALTPRGVEEASRLAAIAGRVVDKARSADRMSRDVQVEVDRMLGSEAFKLFANGQQQRILDTDFYHFLGCTVRTPRNDFLGRLHATEAAVEASSKLEQPSAEAARELVQVWKLLQKRFADLIDRRRRAE
jgi:hypothetical protein